jgi:hypothetical protein
MTHNQPSSETRAYNKFAQYIDSCTNTLHIGAADTLITVFRLRYPAERVLATKLCNQLQLKRIEISYRGAFSAQ